jgi:hypothetical protein
MSLLLLKASYPNVIWLKHLSQEFASNGMQMAVISADVAFRLM